MKFVINTHSVVDVITNSSTEIFVCNTDKSIEVVEQCLRAMLSVYNSENGYAQLFEDVFTSIRIANEDDIEWYSDCVLEMQNTSIIIEPADDWFPRSLSDAIVREFNAQIVM